MGDNLAVKGEVREALEHQAPGGVDLGGADDNEGDADDSDNSDNSDSDNENDDDGDSTGVDNDDDESSNAGDGGALTVADSDDSGEEDAGQRGDQVQPEPCASVRYNEPEIGFVPEVAPPEFTLTVIEEGVEPVTLEEEEAGTSVKTDEAGVELSPEFERHSEILPPGLEPEGPNHRAGDTVDTVDASDAEDALEVKEFELLEKIIQAEETFEAENRFFTETDSTHGDESSEVEAIESSTVLLQLEENLSILEMGEPNLVEDQQLTAEETPDFGKSLLLVDQENPANPDDVTVVETDEGQHLVESVEAVTGDQPVAAQVGPLCQVDPNSRHDEAKDDPEHIDSQEAEVGEPPEAEVSDQLDPVLARSAEEASVDESRSRDVDAEAVVSHPEPEVVTVRETGASSEQIKSPPTKIFEENNSGQEIPENFAELEIIQNLVKIAAKFEVSVTSQQPRQDLDLVWSEHRTR